MKTYRITYFFRNPAGGFSIAKVSKIFVDFFSKTSCVQQVVLPQHVKGICDMIQNFTYTFHHRNRLGINHITGDCHFIVMALFGCKSVLTIHDTVLIDNETSFFRRFLFKWIYYVIPIRMATKVVCISENTKQSIARFTHRTDIEVIPNAIDEQLFHQVPYSFHTACPNILFVGTGWNKNVAREVRALNQIPCNIQIIGNMTPEISSALEATHAQYEIFSNLSDEEIFDRYVESDIVCFCSLYEGFGMPIIEANATGRPVITSKIAPLTEVAADAAYYVTNPEDEDEIRRALMTVIQHEDVRKKLISNGQNNILRFTRRRIVEQYARVYDELS